MKRFNKLIFSCCLLAVSICCCFIANSTAKNVYALSEFCSSSNLFPLVNSSRPLPYYPDNNTPRVSSPYKSKYAPVQTLDLYSSSYDNRPSLFNGTRIPNSYHIGGQIVNNQVRSFSVYFPLWYVINDLTTYQFLYGFSTDIASSHTLNNTMVYFDLGFYNPSNNDFTAFYSHTASYGLVDGVGMMPYRLTPFINLEFPDNFEENFYSFYCRLSIQASLKTTNTTDFSYFSPCLFYNTGGDIGFIMTDTDDYSSYAYKSNAVNELTNYLISYDKVYETSYQVGYNTGYSLATSTSPGSYQEGYEAGFISGEAQGKAEGFNEGYSSGDTSGYNRGLSYGQQLGYNNGYQVGYQEGLNTEGVDNMLGNAMITVVELPWKLIKQILNFEVLGINFASLFLGLFTLVIVFWLLRHFS